jgi:hypothetical protein
MTAAASGRRGLFGKYRGQRQKWFALRFTGSDADRPDGA